MRPARCGSRSGWMPRCGASFPRGPSAASRSWLADPTEPAGVPVGGGLVLLTRQPRRSTLAAGKRLLASAVDKTAHRTRGQLGPRGPESVLASLRRGLRANGLPFALNPPGIDSAKTVGVLSDLDALEA